MSPIKIGISGVAGRMGQALVGEISAATDLSVAAGLERPDSPALGEDIGGLAGFAPLGIACTAARNAFFAASDVVIDFSSPAASVANAGAAAETGTPLVGGTTGLAGAEIAAIEAASRKVAILRAANMSVGITLLLGLARRAAAALDEDFDIEILEMHHRHKKDAPSGTALALGTAAAEGRGGNLETLAERARDGLTGERRPGAIGFAALRGGDVAGDHRVIFAGPGETVTLAHHAADRRIFAKGALRAARWLVTAGPGLYGMDDVLGLKG